MRSITESVAGKSCQTCGDPGQYIHVDVAAVFPGQHTHAAVHGTADGNAQAEAGKLTKPTSDQMKDALKIRNEQGEDAYLDYLEQLESMGVDVQQIAMHVDANRNVSWLETLSVNATDAWKYFGTNAKDTWNNLWR